MKLQHLFAVFPGLPEEKLSTLEVSGIFQDARQVLPGSVFIAIAGHKFDGHDFLPEAVQRGACALVVQTREKVPSGFTGFVLELPDTRQALDLLASRFYWDPGQEMFCVGVTGTNGKTSITYFVEALLNRVGHKTAVMGTVDHHLGARVWPSEGTTPNPILLQHRLKEFRDGGATAVAMEVTSHALIQRRADSVPFNVAIFTNLTRDHLDYHQSMENYFEAKQRLFLDLMWQTTKRPCFAIVNIGDPWGRKLRIAEPAQLLTYGSRDADMHFEIVDVDFASTTFDLTTPWSKNRIRLPMCGTHNVYNAVAALGAGVAVGAQWSLLVEALQNFSGVPGRLQLVPNQKSRCVLVDYAHSPDALDNVLAALQRIRAQKKTKNKIHIVFGCGGDRDKGKRPLMAQSALKGADHVIVTSDNPRTEVPGEIIKDIMTGVSTADQSRVRVIEDRAQAIFEVIKTAAPEDVVLIAGKGHEDYQIIGTACQPFSDFEVSQRALQEDR